MENRDCGKRIDVVYFLITSRHIINTTKSPKDCYAIRLTDGICGQVTTKLIIKDNDKDKVSGLTGPTVVRLCSLTRRPLNDRFLCQCKCVPFMVQRCHIVGAKMN